jgi:hypothetical protein
VLISLLLGEMSSDTLILCIIFHKWSPQPIRPFQLQYSSNAFLGVIWLIISNEWPLDLRSSITFVGSADVFNILIPYAVYFLLYRLAIMMTMKQTALR